MINLDEFTQKYSDALKNDEPVKSEDFTANELSYLFEKRNKIYQWTAYPLMESGQLTAIGNQEYEIGRRFILRG